MEYLIIALKSIAVYVFIVAAIRLFGKKELAQLSVIDLAFYNHVLIIFYETSLNSTVNLIPITYVALNTNIP